VIHDSPARDLFERDTIENGTDHFRRYRSDRSCWVRTYGRGRKAGEKRSGVLDGRFPGRPEAEIQIRLQQRNNHRPGGGREYFRIRQKRHRQIFRVDGNDRLLYAGRRRSVQSLSGTTFTLTVGPTGRIADYSQLDELIKEVGKKAFRAGTDSSRIKEPDMIGDFVATQWFLWDTVSSIEEPSKGVAVGESWTSKLAVPTPMVMRKARDVTYRLDEVRQSEEGRLAVISSSYQAADSAPHDWPIPYSGRFQVAGAFGFYGNYRVLDLQGEGQELFNIDAGRIEQYEQEYQLRLKASLMIPLAGVDPRITINQKLTMTLLGD
jgi:hypothetical protein